MAQDMIVQRRGIDWYGFAGFRGSKAPMQAYAVATKAHMQLQVTLSRGRLAPAGIVEQYTYTRHFVAVDDPIRLLREVLPELPAGTNHTYEIILADKPCKLCMDFDGTDGLPACFASRQDFTSKVQAALMHIFAMEFGVQLQADSFIWVFTDYPVKFSAHLVVHHIMPDGSILCLPHHHPAHATHDGAKHIYKRLVHVMPELEQHELMDGTIYTRDREMRLPGATKPPKPGMHMATWSPNTAYIATNHTLANAMVSYLDGRAPHVLQLPTVERHQIGRQPAASAARKRGNTSAAQKAPPSGVSCTEGEERMLELIMHQHPTAYMLKLGGKNAWDKDNAPRFNHTDRAEPCWCGKAHNSNNYAAWFSGSQAFVHAFGCKRTFRIGSLTDDFSSAEDVEVHCRYLARTQQETVAASARGQPDTLAGGQQTLQRYLVPAQAPELQVVSPTHQKHAPCLPEPATVSDITLLNTELDQLMGMSTRVLGISSSMGSGKTCLLSTLVQELADVHQAKRVLVITYRQTLSLNMLSDLQVLGFENYLDAKEHKTDLSAADRAIVQLDSIAMVCRKGVIVPQYDLVVLDEVESTLHHATAKTHQARQATTFRTFCSIIKASKRVLAMDAFLGAETRAFFKSLQLHARVVRNTWRPQPRTMVFTNDQLEWVAKLVQALAAGQNVAVASMSANMLHRLKKLVVGLGLLMEDELLLYDSAADDALKKRVQFVNIDWVTKRLVMWSPCIEAGVNFDRQHFHSMFLYLCSSTTPLGLMQMSGRIRQLEDRTVLCMCKGLNWQEAAEELTPADAVNHMRWQENLTWPAGFHAELPCDEETLETGEIANLPSASHPAMVVASHNYARIINGRARFLPELTKLIEHAGHKWSKGTWHEKQQKESEEAMPKHDRQSVLLKAAIIDSIEADVLTALQFSNQLRRDQKEALERFFFCNAWGISNHALGAAFFEQHKAADSSAAPLRVLQAALTCGTTLETTPVPLADDGGEMTLPVQARAKVIAELLHALGITNVLNQTQRVTLTPDKINALRTCQAFRSAELSRRTARLFDIHSSASGAFKTVGSITKRIKALFKAGACIKVDSCCCQPHRQAGAAGARPRRVYTISLDNARVSGMAQLLKIKYGRVHRSVWACGEVADYLEQLQLSEAYNRYAAAIDASSPCDVEAHLF